MLLVFETSCVAPYWPFQPQQTPETNYLTLTLRSLGFDTFRTNLLVIPANVLFICQLLFWTWFSERLNQRFFIGLISQLWVIPLIVALETLPAKFPHANWVRFGISSLIVGYPYAHAMLGRFHACNMLYLKSTDSWKFQWRSQAETPDPLELEPSDRRSTTWRSKPAISSPPKSVETAH